MGGTILRRVSQRSFCCGRIRPTRTGNSTKPIRLHTLNEQAFCIGCPGNQLLGFFLVMVAMKPNTEVVEFDK